MNKVRTTIFMTVEMRAKLQSICTRGSTQTFHIEEAIAQYLDNYAPFNPPAKKKEVAPVEHKYSDTDYKLAEYIYAGVLDVAPKTKQPNMGKWADIIRLMVSVDGHTHREIAALFKWANKDEFWAINIKSPDKLRKQYATLHAKASSNENNKSAIASGQTKRTEASAKVSADLDKLRGFAEQSHSQGGRVLVDDGQGLRECLEHDDGANAH